MPDAVDLTLCAAGHGDDPFGDARKGLVRLMCAFDTTTDDVDALLETARGA